MHKDYMQVILQLYGFSRRDQILPWLHTSLFKSQFLAEPGGMTLHCVLTPRLEHHPQQLLIPFSHGLDTCSTNQRAATSVMYSFQCLI